MRKNISKKNEINIEIKHDKKSNIIKVINIIEYI
jgi:hypothetical protein